MIRFAINTRHLCANVNVAGARRSEKPRVSAKGGVITHETVRQRGFAHCRIGIPKIITKKRARTYGYIAATHGISRERGYPGSRVVGAADVAHECVKTDGGVAVAGSIALERPKPDGGVFCSTDVAKDRASTDGRVCDTDCIAKERVDTKSCVAIAGCVRMKRIDPGGGIETAGAVRDKVKRSDGRVGEPCAVSKKRAKAYCGILI